MRDVFATLLSRARHDGFRRARIQFERAYENDMFSYEIHVDGNVRPNCMRFVRSESPKHGTANLLSISELSRIDFISVPENGFENR